MGQTANKTFEPLSKTRLHEEIVEQLQRKIIKGEFKAGEKLPPERDLALSLNVNRGTLREALKKLELLELIEIRHGDGVYVKNFLESSNLNLVDVLIRSGDILNQDVIGGVLYIRKIILPEIAYLSALNRTKSEIKEMEQLVFGNKTISIIERDKAIYRMIALSSKNIPFVILLNFFNNNVFTNELLELYFSDKKNHDRTEKFYKDIFSAIKDREPKKSKKIMSDFMAFAEKKTYENLKKSGSVK